MEKETLKLNIHIPFCTGHCVYCERKNFGQNIGYLQRYRRALEIEVESATEELQNYDIASVHICSDSLSLFGVGAMDDFLRKLQEAIPSSAQTEWVVELMPSEIAPEYLHILQKRRKIDRISLELMACTKEELAALRRPYTKNIVEHALKTLQEQPLPGLGIRLAIGIPDQTTDSLKETLDQVLLAVPDQISFLRYHNNRTSAAEQRSYAEETDWQSYIRFAEGYLAQHGFEREGKSLCFARPDRIFRENQTEAAAWNTMGFGIGAVTQLDGLCYRNTNDFALYMEHSDDPQEIAVII
jgi:coproporphyrinogen III oxidase-like Fe-S oxidoreductase